jgi:tyrosyl-tRNA synthetase
VQAGCHFKFWVADWFAQLNNKMDGNLAKIQTVGKYMIEIWKAVGMDMRNVQFLWARLVHICDLPSIIYMCYVYFEIIDAL